MSLDVKATCLVVAIRSFSHACRDVFGDGEVSRYRELVDAMQAAWAGERLQTVAVMKRRQGA